MDGDTTLVIGDRRERGRLGEHAAGIRTVLERGQVADVFGYAGEQRRQRDSPSRADR
jgi:hypothetical protein